MHILYLLPKLVNAGPSNVVATIISHPAMQAHDITIATFLGKDDSHDNLLSKQHINYLSLGGVNFRAIRRLVAYIKAKNIEVVHSHGLIPDIVSALIAIWVPSLRVSTVHCDIKQDYAMEYPRLKAKLYTSLHFLALQFIPNRAVVSKSVQSTLPFSSQIVRNGVPQQTTENILNEQSPSTETPGLTLVFAGRLIKRKNVQFLIDCVTRFNQHHQQTLSLHIYGEGELESALKKTQSAHINFLGFNDSFAAQMPSNAIFANPSLAEGLPMAVIELLAHGVPCILSNIEPHQEIADCMDVGVALFDFDYDSFASAINQLTTSALLIDVDRSLLSASFAKSLSDKQMVDGYIALYQPPTIKNASVESSVQLHSTDEFKE